MFVLGLMGGAGPAMAQSFPDEGGWTVLPCGDEPMTDPSGDESGLSDERDLVGDVGSPVGYHASDAAYAYFRMKLDKDPTQGNGLRPFAWAILLDRDADLTTYEAAVMLDGNGDVVELYRNSTTTIPDDPTDPPDTPAVAVWTLGSRVRSVGVGGDSYLDVAVPWDELAAVGIEPSTALTVWMMTSSNTGSLNGDFVCHDGLAGGPRSLSAAVDASGPVDTGTGGTGTDGTGTGTDGTGTDGTGPGGTGDPLDPDADPGDLLGGLVLEGGGGCSTAPGGLVASLLALGAVARRRRR